MSQKQLSAKEQIMFFRQFGLFLQGGLPLLDSLRTMNPYLKNKKAKKLVDKLTIEVEKGQLLSQALLLFPKIFDVLVVSLVEVGEASGTLSSSLLAAAEELQQRQNAKKKVIASLLYPAIILIATGSVLGLLMFYVFPKILPIFSSLHARVPLATRLLIYLEHSTKQLGWLLLIPLGVISFILWLFFAHKRLKKLRDRCLLATPFIGQIAKNYFLAHFCRTLGQLLQKQVPVIRAVVVTANSTSNICYKQRIIALSVAVNRGQSLTQFLNQEALFPPVLKQLVSVGEKTGTLSENLTFLADLYSQEVTDALSRLSIVLEPAMMLVIGGIVGFVAISIITPIYQITQNLHA
jgi:type IV pilus assembly protein PilC